MATGSFVDSHMAGSSLGHILGICSPTRSLHLELYNYSQHLLVSVKEASGFNDMKHLRLQSSCRGGKSKTRTPKAPGERLQHMVILHLGSNLLKSTDHG